MSLITRIAALEAARRAKQMALASGIRFCDFPGGRPDPDVVAEVIGAGGACILMPRACSEDEWQTEAMAAQADLQRRANVYFATGVAPE